MRTIQRDIVGGFIFSSDGKILLGKTVKGGVYQDKWLVPGGGVEAGETRLDAVRREILEEVGIDVSIGKVEDVSTNLSGESEKNLRDTGEKVLVKMNFFDYKISLPLNAEKLKPIAGDDFTSPRWFTSVELNELELAKPTIAKLKYIGFLKD